MDAKITLICPICAVSYEKKLAYYNKAIKAGLNNYCGRACAGIGRRSGKTKEQKVAEKSEYDKKYRYYHRDGIKQRKAEAFQRDYKANPEKYRAQRRQQKQNHAEYCRQPEYRKWKKNYDIQYRAKKLYGKFWECAILVFKIEAEIDNKIAKEENNLINKSQKRKRLWKSSQQRT